MDKLKWAGPHLKWLGLIAVVALLMVGCHKLAKKNHEVYYKDMGCPCKCIN